MPRVVKPLNDREIKALKPTAKAYSKADGNGMHLLVKPDGTKLWEFIYLSPTLHKRRKTSFGTYPTTSLSIARELRQEAIDKIKLGIDIIDEKREVRESKKTQREYKDNTFENLALERLEKVKDNISETHYKRTLTAFKNDCFPYIGSKNIDEIEARDIIKVLQIMSDRGINDSARKLYYAINKTFKWAVSNAKAKRNPAGDIELDEILGKLSKNHYPTITDDKGIKALLENTRSYSGDISTKNGLLLLAYTFIRPINVRMALWKEINLNNKQWVIPAKKMKTKQELIVPLSDGAIAILEEMQEYSFDMTIDKDKNYVFPSTKSKTTPFSDGALLGAIRRMGYTTDEFTPHGFRAMFSTIAHEKSKFKYDAIEIQLAHKVGNSVSQAYNRAEYLDERVQLMQWWSDYLQGICDA